MASVNVQPLVQNYLSLVLIYNIVSARITNGYCKPTIVSAELPIVGANLQSLVQNYKWLV